LSQPFFFAFLFTWDYALKRMNLGGGRFKTIKKLAIREYTLKRMNPRGGSFKAIKSKAALHLLPFLFAFTYKSQLLT
jgi:hypothetical protein